MGAMVKSEPVSKVASVKPASIGRQAQGDGRKPGRDEPGAPGTSGAALGLSGDELQALGFGWLCAGTIVILIAAIDILTRAHDQPERGLAIPVIDEVSSAMVTLVVIALPAALALWMRRRSPPLAPRILALAMAAAAYPVLHVAGFVGLRTLAYGLFLGQDYQFGPVVPEFLYETGKDVPAFLFATTAFWLFLQWRGSLSAPVTPPPTSEWFDIRDGARLVRAPIADILAVRSAGNYAEFVLSDGRRPLMRASLGGLESALGRHGFVRTHRSWLVNAARVTGLQPEGSGDYAVELGELQAPLSRRFPEALAALRG